MAIQDRIHNIVSEFSEMDTIELCCNVLDGKKVKGFLLNWLINPWTSKGFYDEVFIGKPRIAYAFNWGDNIILNTTRLVLIEKYDKDLVPLINNHYN